MFLIFFRLLGNILALSR